MYNNNNCACFKSLLVLLAAATTTNLLFAGQQLVHANPLNSAESLNFKDDIAKASKEEIDDMNLKVLDIPVSVPDGYSSREFLHRDEDQLTAAPATIISPLTNKLNENNLDDLKYEVEMLEPLNNERDTDDLEERYRGAASLHVNTNTFTADNIEMDSDEKEVNIMVVPQNHLALTIILVSVAIVSIGLYAALVIWRTHLEQRYGMRELLVANDDDYFVSTSPADDTPTVYA